MAQPPPPPGPPPGADARERAAAAQPADSSARPSSAAREDKRAHKDRIFTDVQDIVGTDRAANITDMILTLACEDL
eukprot:2498982-Heterocapsa_arctica.AAC.1